MEASGLVEQGLTGFVLLRIPAETIAEQLFIFHLKYLVAVDPADDMSLLLDRLAMRRSRNPLVFSHQSPHFLTRLVYTHVLALDTPDSSSDVSRRAKLITRWIEIGQYLKTYGDLAGFLAIASALLSIPILRLKETWTDVDVDVRTMVIRDWSPMMKELHRRELGVEVGSWTAHVLTPDLKRDELDSRVVIPYYGDICAALEAFEIWAVSSFKDTVDPRFLRILMSTFSKLERHLPPLSMPSQDGLPLKKMLLMTDNVQKISLRNEIRHCRLVLTNSTPVLPKASHILRINSLKRPSKQKLHPKVLTSSITTLNGYL
jgi:RasGEF domain